MRAHAGEAARQVTIAGQGQGVDEGQLLPSPPRGIGQPGGAEFRRSVAVEEFSYNADGSIPFIKQTEAGPTANPTRACK